MTYALTGSTKHLQMIGSTRARKFATYLMDRRVSFACDPLPGDMYEFALKAEDCDSDLLIGWTTA